MAVRLVLLGVAVLLSCTACDSAAPARSGEDPGEAVAGGEAALPQPEPEPGPKDVPEPEDPPSAVEEEPPLQDLKAVACEQMKEFHKALEFRFIDTGKHPESLEVLTESIMGSECYMPFIPADPWGEAYVYRPNDGDWVLFSNGPDRTADTEDDVRLE